MKFVSIVFHFVFIGLTLRSCASSFFFISALIAASCSCAGIVSSAKQVWVFVYRRFLHRLSSHFISFSRTVRFRSFTFIYPLPPPPIVSIFQVTIDETCCRDKKTEKNSIDTSIVRSFFFVLCKNINTGSTYYRSHFPVTVYWRPY